MDITPNIKKYIDQSVLCWLATVDQKGVPNVSPKEIYTVCNDKIIIANIASPNTVKNIKYSESVCISFIDVLVQKGYQLKGKARIIEESDSLFEKYASHLLSMTGGAFPFHSVTEIEIEKSKPIVAPRYLIYPETKESEQIERAKIQYRLNS